MHSYRSERVSNKKYIIQYGIIYSVVAAIAIVLLLISKPAYSVGSYYFASLMALAGLSNFLFKKRVEEVFLDTDKQQVVVRYYHIIEGEVVKSYDFSVIRIEIREKSWLSPLEIHLLDRNKLMLSISETKDGFPPDTLNAFRTALYSLTSPARRL